MGDQRPDVSELKADRSGHGPDGVRLTNLQAISHGFGYHSAVRAIEGRILVKADYSQIELRLAAKL